MVCLKMLKEGRMIMAALRMHIKTHVYFRWKIIVFVIIVIFYGKGVYIYIYCSNLIKPQMRLINGVPDLKVN